MRVFYPTNRIDFWSTRPYIRRFEANGSIPAQLCCTAIRQKHFPVRLAYAMMINKCQRKTLQRVRIVLQKACSRMRNCSLRSHARRNLRMRRCFQRQSPRCIGWCIMLYIAKRTVNDLPFPGQCKFGVLCSLERWVHFGHTFWPSLSRRLLVSYLSALRLRTSVVTGTHWSLY